MLPDVATDAAAAAAAIVAIGAAVALGPRTFRSWSDHCKRRDLELRDSVTVIAEQVADRATRTLSDKLFSPNGGRSLHDIAGRVDLVLGELRDLARRREQDAERTERLERQVFEVIIPRQADIAAKLEADRRASDHAPRQPEE